MKNLKSLVMSLILTYVDFINENKKIELSEHKTGEEIREILLKYGRNAYGKFHYEDVKNLIMKSADYKLVDLPIEKVKEQLTTVDETYKNKSNFPPIIHKYYDDYEIIDGKHRIAQAYATGEKTIMVYLWNEK